MALTTQLVEHIAGLARLELTEAEKERFTRQLSDILDYAARLQQVDTRSVEAAASAGPVIPPSPLRPDQARPGLATASLLSSAPVVQADQFRIPPVLE